MSEEMGFTGETGPVTFERPMQRKQTKKQKEINSLVTWMVRGALFLALWNAITNIIPYVGPYIGGIPIILFAFTTDYRMGIIILIIIIQRLFGLNRELILLA